MTRDPATDTPLLICNDPERFWELARINDDQERRAAFKHSMLDLIIAELLRTGVADLEGSIQSAALAYSTCVEHMSVEDRRIILRQVIETCEAMPVLQAEPLLGVIRLDNDSDLVADAVIAHLSLAPVVDDDPMFRVRNFITWIVDDEPGSRAGIFAGLLYLGDERVCRLLVPARHSLETADIEKIIAFPVGFTHRAIVEFYIDWLESLDPERERDLFHLLCAALTITRRQCENGRVYTSLRMFPLPTEPDSWHPAHTTIARHARKIASRLYSLEAAEIPLRAMPLVLKEWGLEPRTPLDQAIRVKGRH